MNNDAPFYFFIKRNMIVEEKERKEMKRRDTSESYLKRVDWNWLEIKWICTWSVKYISFWVYILNHGGNGGNESIAFGLSWAEHCGRQPQVHNEFDPLIN